MASMGAFRLRLLIRRYSLPEVKVVWPCTPSDDLTISRLLTLVNEVIPLESQDWGLEDYAVELADAQGSSFECLHFQRVNQILKHDDQILIRSLLTDDLKQRRVSGRDQISSDGKHLFDGVPFGRPLLKAPRGRPPVSLPPRKRARIDFQPDETDEDHDEPRQLLLEQPSRNLDYNEASDARVRALFDDDDMSGDDEDEEDSDFGVEDDESMGSDNLDEEPDVPQLGGLEPDELEGLKQDNRVCKEGAIESSDEDSDDDETSSSGSSDESEDGEGEDVLMQMQLLKADSRLGADDSEPGQLLEPDNHASALESIRIDWSEKLMILRTAFPLTPLPSIRKEFLAAEEDLRRTYNALCLTNNPVQSFDQMMDDALCGPDSSHQLQQQAQPRSRPLIQEVESSDEAVGSGPPLITAVDAKESSSSESSDSDFDSDAESESESEGSQDSRNGSSGSGNSDDENGAGVNGGDNTVIINRNAHDARSESDSSDEDSSSDGSKDEALQDLTNDLLEDSDHESDESEQPSESDSSSESNSSTSDSSSEADSSDDEPTEPMIKSAKQKQSASQAVKATKVDPKQTAQTAQTGPLPVAPGKGLSRTRKRNERRRKFARMNSKANTSAESVQENGEADSLEARRQALLQSLGITQMDTSEDGPPGPNGAAQNGTKAESVIDKGKAYEPPTEEKSKKADVSRTRLDVDASTGLNEGPLKNAQLGEMKKIQVATEEPASDSSSSVSSDSSSEEEEEDPDAWKQKISYRAVECVQQGIILSEPPFPFKQRWDPQQHYSVVRKRKREEAEATPFDESFVGDDTQWNYEEEEEQSKPMKKRKRKGKQAAEPAVEEVTTLDYGDPPVVISALDADMVGAADAAQTDTQISQLSDLPQLPEDMSSLPLLKKGEAAPGMVITWKEMKLSKNFEPQIVSITALVLEAKPDEPLNVILAMRDREQDERQYDEETGERIYQKFDAPSDDEDEPMEEDDGQRTISPLNMIEARIVQQPPEQATSLDVTAPESQSQPVPASPSQQLNGEAAFEESLVIPSGQGPQQPENPFHQLFPTGSVSTSREADSTNVSKALIVEVEEQVDEAPEAGLEPEPSGMDVDGQVSAPTDTIKSRTTGQETHDSDHKQPTSATTGQERDDVAQESVLSGRQPEHEQKEAPAHLVDMDHDSIIPETLPVEADILAQKDTQSSTSSSSDPILSLEELWSQPKPENPNSSAKSEKSAIKERNAKINSDPAYDEAMAKLDNGEVSDEDFQSASIKRKLFPPATQHSKFAVEVPDETPAEEPKLSILEPSEPPRSAKKKTRSSPFVVPAGSQVVDLESDASPVKESEKGSARGRPRGRSSSASRPTARAVHSSPPSENTRHRKASVSASQPSPGRRGRGRRASRGGRHSMTQK